VQEDAVYRRCPDVRFRIVLDEGVVIKQDTAEVMVLNEVGARVLDLIDGRRTAADIGDALAGEFEIGNEELRRDLAGYLAELVEAGLVEPVGA
jgi:coenzyme PQQ synthesis protein D (PqqD)